MSSEMVFGVLQAGGIEVAVSASMIQEVVEWPAHMVRQILAPPYVIGTFTLRGGAVPTLDLRRLMDVADDANARARIAVLQTSRGRFGLAVDHICDVVKTRAANIHPLNVAATRAERPLVQSLLLEDGGARIIQVLDVEVLALRPGVAPVASEPTGEAKASNHYLQHFMFFDCDNLRFCIRAAVVREVINRPELDRSCRVGAAFHGTLRLRGESIPVVDLFNVLAVSGTDAPKTKLMILEVERKTIAVPVSEVVAIQRLRVEHVMPLPGFGLRRPDMFHGVVTGVGTGKETLMLSEDALLLSHQDLLRDHDVAALQRLHDGLDIEQPHRHRSRTGTRTALLKFQAGQPYWTTLQGVQEIIAMPKQHIHLQSADGLMVGLLKRRGAMIPLIRFSGLLGNPETAPDQDTRLLVVKGLDSTFAFIVDQVSAIEHVFIHEPPEATNPAPTAAGRILEAATATITVESSNGRTLMPLLNLTKLARLLEQMPKAA